MLIVGTTPRLEQLDEPEPLTVMFAREGEPLPCAVLRLYGQNMGA
jgi:hypothetical protein